MRSMMSLEMVMNMIGLLLERMKLSTWKSIIGLI